MKKREQSTPMTAGYVLAGGMSSRFDGDKALAEIAGMPMLARMIGLLRNAVRTVRVVGSPEKYAQYGAKVIADRWPEEGPLGGIVTALLYTKQREPAHKWNLILSCDMPFLTEEWLAFLVKRAESSKAEVVYPRSSSGPEPLCACWRTEAVETLRSAFESGTRKVMEGVKLLREEVLDEADWKRFDNFDSGGRLFWNMNTRKDYQETRRILETRQK